MAFACRLLALWFSHGTRKDVEAALVQGINLISIDTWLAVIPQMIARIHTPHPSVRKLLHDLLCKIGLYMRIVHVVPYAVV